MFEKLKTHGLSYNDVLNNITFLDEVSSLFDNKTKGVTTNEIETQIKKTTINRIVEDSIEEFINNPRLMGETQPTQQRGEYITKLEGNLEALKKKLENYIPKPTSKIEDDYLDSDSDEDDMEGGYLDKYINVNSKSTSQKDIEIKDYLRKKPRKI